MATRHVYSVRLVLIIVSVALIVLIIFTTAEFPAVVLPLLAFAWLLIPTLHQRYSRAAHAHSGSGNPRAPPPLA